MKLKRLGAGILARGIGSSGRRNLAAANSAIAAANSAIAPPFKMTPRKKPLTPLLLAIFIIKAGLAYAASPAPALPGPTPPARPNIDPQAVKIVRRACDELARPGAFTFHAEVMFDQVLKSGVKLQFAGALDYAVQRPNHLAVEYESDLGGKRLWYDGKMVTLFDLPNQVYASVPASGSIDQMMEHMNEVYNLSLPLGDMASGTACEQIDKHVNFGAWVGINDVLGKPCDHIAFALSSADYQVWIQHTGKPLPLKVVINYRALRGSPLYIAFISDWNFPAAIPQAHFTPDLPQGALRIDFAKAKEQKP
jgi:hypothetical protein